MTDEDFEKVDEDFASEFDFVDSNDGTAKGGGGAAAPTTGDSMGGPQQPKGGSPAVVSLMILISVLGGGYYVYSHFFSKSASTDAVKPPEAPKAANAGDLPTLPEHGDKTAAAPMIPGAAPTMPGSATPATQPTSMPPLPTAPTSKEAAANSAAEALNTKPGNDLTSALPPANPSGDKSFEQMQKEIHGAQTPQQAHQVQQAQQQQPVVPPEVKNALQTISEEMTMNVNNIRQLENTISNMAITLDHLNKTITAMDNRVLSLTETVDGLSLDLANVKKVMIDQDLDLTLPGNIKSSSSRKQTQTISNTDANYSVHAIIPGRAWLKSNGGQIITVTEGDKVGDYGTVAVIDASNGLVRTSSGIIIR